MILKPGDTIVHGKYQIVDLLGKGGFGEVYKALDTQLEREVAIKVIQRSAAGSTAAEFLDYEARFKTEARIGAQIRDDNVIAVYALEKHGRDLVLEVSEYAAGGTLATRIAAKALPPEQVIEIGIQICKGLAAIHRPPINGVHRDIKPSNILFDQLGRAKVADLGLVQIYGMSGARSQGMGGAQPGTPGYMSPEQETETGYLTPASDVYSLGCVLFEALTQKVYQHLPRGIKVSSLKPDVPAALEAVLEKALAVDISARYQDAEAMRLALEAVQGAVTARQAQRLEAANFQFRGGAKAKSPKEWAELADKYWEDGVYHLSQGSLEQWLQFLNRHDLAAQVAEIRRKHTDGDFTLEQVLNLLLPNLEQPQLYVDNEALDFAQVERGESQIVRLTVSNHNRGLLYGSLRPQVPWIRIPLPAIKCHGGQTQVVEVALNSSILKEGETAAERAIEIDTNGGQVSLSCRVGVTWAPELTVSPGRLDFGEHLVGSAAELRGQTLTVRNKGGGMLHGELTTSADWLAISPASFELGNEKEIAVQLTADPARLSELRIYNTEVKIASSAGSQVIPASITFTSPLYQPATRWKKWGIYLGLMAFIVAGWTVPLAIGLNWLLGLQYTPPVWQIIGLAIWPILAWITALAAPRRLAKPLDEIENFYHRGNLTEEIPGRQPAFLRRVIFGLLLGGAAAYFASQARGAEIFFRPLEFSMPLTWLGGTAGFMSGFLLINSRRPGKDFTLRDRLLAGPRAILLAVVIGVLRLAIWPGYFQTWDMIWPVALGFVLAGDNFTTLPLRLHWLFARLKPILPGIILMGLFYQWAKSNFLQPGSSNLVEYYTLHTSISGSWYLWWKDLLFVIGILLLARLGLWLNNARDDDGRRNLPATFAALLVAGIPALLGYLALGFVRSLLKNWIGPTSFLGVLGILLVVGLAGLSLWLIGRRRQWLKRGLDGLFARLTTLLSKLPAKASRATEKVTRSAERTGLGDYLTLNTVIPPTAGLMAVTIIGFTLPAFYGVLATFFQIATRIGIVVLLLLLCTLLPAGLIAAGYLFWKRSQEKK